MELYSKKLKSLPQKTTYLNELNRIGKQRFGSKYHGTYASDQIPKLKPMQSCILNLDKGNQPGSHWIAVARGRKNQCYVYDSFGRRGVELIPALRWKLPGRVVDSDRDIEQAINETNCGARCISWINVFYTQGIKKALTI